MTTEYPEVPAPAGGVGGDSTESGSLSGIARSIAEAAVWLRFMAILGFIGAGFMAFAGIIFILIDLPMYGGYGRIVGLLYLIMAGLYLIPLIPLNRSASFASRLRTQISYEVAVKALQSQAVFWRRVGILSIIGLALALISIPIAVMVGLASR